MPCRNFIIAKRDIAYRKVIEIPAVGGFKSGYRNVSLRVQFLRNAPGDAVQLHAIQAAACMVSGSIPKKLPTPMLGSRILPLRNPIFSTAS